MLIRDRAVSQNVLDSEITAQSENAAVVTSQINGSKAEASVETIQFRRDDSQIWLLRRTKPEYNALSWDDGVVALSAFLHRRGSVVTFSLIPPPRGQTHSVFGDTGYFRVSIIHQTLTWTTGFLTCVHGLQYACVYTLGLGTLTL